MIQFLFEIVESLHRVKSVGIRSHSGPHFSRIFPHSDWIQRDTPYPSVFSWNAGKCGENAEQNNSEYGLFLRSACFQNICSQLFNNFLSFAWTFRQDVWSFFNTLWCCTFMFKFRCRWVFITDRISLVDFTCWFSCNYSSAGTLKSTDTTSLLRYL